MGFHGRHHRAVPCRTSQHRSRTEEARGSNPPHLHPTSQVRASSEHHRRRSRRPRGAWGHTGATSGTPRQPDHGAVWYWLDSAEERVQAGRLRTAPLGRWSRSLPRSWGRACVGQRRRRPGRRGAMSRRVPRRPGRLEERHPASWKLWLRDWPSTAWRRARGLLGDGLALLCFPMSVRKEVDEEPRGHASLVGPE
jgi:hypothetical protein